MPTYESSVTNTIVNAQTGEMQEIETKKRMSYRIKDSDEFYMVFYNCLAGTLNIKSKKTIDLLSELCKHAQFNTGIIEVSTNIRKTVCKNADVNLSNFSKHINILKEAGLLSDRGDRSYLINPRVFWKGDLKEREKLLKDKNFYIEFGFELQ